MKMSTTGYMRKPSFRNLTKKGYGQPPYQQHLPLQALVKPHIESFNYMLKDGLAKAIQNIPPVEFRLPSGLRVSLHVQDAFIAMPVVAPGNQHAATQRVYPAECRERGVTYRAKMTVSVIWEIDGVSHGPEERNIGEVPIMVKSNACNLKTLNPALLVKRGEEAEEMGGYFIVNGNEKIVRMLIMTRRNYWWNRTTDTKVNIKGKDMVENLLVGFYTESPAFQPMAILRPSWKGLGPQYTEYGVSMRCVAEDQTSVNVTLHYLNNGTVNLSFTFRKEQFFMPVILVLRSLMEVPDQYLFTELTKGKENNSFYKGCIANMLRLAQSEGLGTQSAVLKFIGERFRIKTGLPEWYTDKEVARYLLEYCLCIHLKNNKEKLNVLIYMTRKLFSFAKGECCAESPDNPMFQEILLGGHLYLMALKEKVEMWLYTVKLGLLAQAKRKAGEFTVDLHTFNEACRRGTEVTRPMEYLMATGNLSSRTGLGLMQAKGLTVVADKLNFYRYLSHFRCVHRGAFFSEMRTTAVRKLLPEAWGFLCPVHTPDGSPCGLLNHLAANCQVVNTIHAVGHLPKLLCQLGMQFYDAMPPGAAEQYYCVILDGATIGWLHDSIAESVCEQLRQMKVHGLENVPNVLEICLVPKTAVASQYPGVFLFSTPARMIRPVRNLSSNQKQEFIGTFEQVYLNICITSKEGVEGLTTHRELREDGMLSCIASLTPYSDYNQSPRNMYQCQMGKQTMGTPLHAFSHRSDNKLYRIQTPQSPIVRPHMYDQYCVDDYPLGTNAVVAVISYTGYDMEDAMILNKSSFERGFAHGSIYKTEFIDLKEKSGERGKVSCIFGTKPDEEQRTKGSIDIDGLPPIGTYLTTGDAYYSYTNIQTGEVRVERYKSMEPAYVDNIKILGNDLGTSELHHVAITLRLERNPIIGDKFSSRHGQKGICSQKWPVENMPFSETGMVPDIIFNPHGFPSRMTIGMMIESMAGKSGAMHGLCHDATPFTFSEETPPIDYFGQHLIAAGYNYYGTERMYSGVTGREFEADIFMGIVYYQRLRHMVSDKFQVRTTGPIDQVTHQPIKGRKRGGGIRFGEMERDGLLAHGTSFLLEDRLLNCSDKSTCLVCSKCGSLVSPIMEKAPSANAAASFENAREWHCRICKRTDGLQLIQVPYVFRYLVAELAAMNIKVTLDVVPKS